jgi:hypothetical protein
MALPPGAHGSSRTPTPSAGHAGVVVVSIALAAGLVAASTAVGDGGLLTLLVLLMGGFALVIPVSLLVTLWRQVRPPARVLLALGLLACAALLAYAVARIAAVAPLVL